MSRPTQREIHEIAVLCKASRALAKDAAELVPRDDVLQSVVCALHALTDALEKLTISVSRAP